MPMRMRDVVVKPMHPDGRRFVAIFAAATLVLFLVAEPLGWIGLGLTVWCYYFFRDPERVTPAGSGLVVSPADGIVSQIAPVAPPAELGLPETPLTRVSVFMSVFDCHVNRMPVAGRITAVDYRAGTFVNASLDKASTDNERNALALETEGGDRLVVVQIAGLVARRILCFASQGDRLATGERFGLIRFGSRLDLYLPPGVTPKVAVGQTAIAGETVFADLAAPRSET